MGRTRLVSALCAFFVVTMGLAACGGGNIPGDAVVKVGDHTIKKATFEHWLKIAAIAMAQQADPAAARSGAAPKAVVPAPPDFKACVADKTRQAAKPAKGQPEQSPAQFKKQCSSDYDNLRKVVEQFLINAEWISGEAADRNVKITDKQVIKQFTDTKKTSFPKEADFQKFLKASGMTLNDLLLRIKIDTLTTKLKTAVVKSDKKVTPARIQAFYDTHKAQFSQPERRDLRIVLTKTQATAQRALSQLKGGASFGKVAKKLSIDQASKSQGGVLLAVGKGQQEKALDTAVFAAAKGKLTGPVKTQFGYYVFKVQRITTATQKSLKEVTPTIKGQLASESQQKVLETFVKRFTKKWKAKTDCRKGFVTENCKNFKKPKAGTASTGAVPPQAPPQSGGADGGATPPPVKTTTAPPSSKTTTTP